MRPPLVLGFAVTHAAPAYPAGAATLLAGAKAAEALGASSLKVYLTPNVAEKYRDEAWPAAKNLTELAQTPSFKALFARNLSVFVLTTYTFANGIDGGFMDGLDDLEAASEYAELRELADYLLTAYRGTGKRFVIQNWEGDFAARGGFEPGRRATPAANEGMKRWIAERQRAVTDARAAIGEDGVRIDHAFELNALLADASDHVGERVLQSVCVDLVSYSSWECFAPLYDGGKDAIERSERALQSAITRLRTVACPQSRFYLGEIGLAENELAEPLRQPVSEWLSRLPSLLGPSAGVIWWQIYDNECKNAVCRGLGLLRPDGSRSVILESIQRKKREP